MTTPHTPSSCLFRALRRAVLGAGSLALSGLLPAQMFQHAYGGPLTLPEVEFGTSVVKAPTGYLVVGQQGNDVAGVLTNINGGMIAHGRHAATTPGVTLTPESARVTSAGGVIVSGEVQGGPDVGYDVFLAYYAANGAMWPQGGPGANRYLLYRGERTGKLQGTRVVERNLGQGFGVIANTQLAGGGSRGVLFTTAPNGTLMCWQSFGLSGHDVRFHDLCQDTDGTFLVVGSMRSLASARRVTMVMRVEPCGIVHWVRLYTISTGGEDVEQHAITATANGKFAVWGHFSPTSLSPGSFLFEIDATGAVMFRTHFPTIAGTRPTITKATVNDELLMNGRSGADAVVLRTNSAGVATVACTYGGVGTDEFFQVLPTHHDGGFVATGSTQLAQPLSDFYLVKGIANGDSYCNWQTLVAPQTFPTPLVTTRQLSVSYDNSMRVLEMNPLAPSFVHYPQCLSPVCTYSGDPTGTTGGLPSVASTTPALRGSADFPVNASGLVPNGLALFALSASLALPGLPLSMIGGQPGSMLYLDPASLSLLPVLNDANGQASLSFPIPNNPALAGVALHWQVFDFDLTLPYSLPLGNSQAMTVVIQ